MLADKNFKDVVTAVLIIGLFILAFMILRPIISSIIFAILLAYIFHPIYSWIYSKTKMENISAFLICLLLLLIVLIPVVLILNSLIKQAINFYLELQNLDLTLILKGTMPSFFSSDLGKIIGSALNRNIPVIMSFVFGKFSGFVLNLPVILLHILVVIFVFFFSLRDGKKAVDYLKTLSPLSKEVENKFFDHFKEITNSVLLGQVVVGVVQGIVAGVGYFIFGVPNAIFLTILSIFAAIIPLLGPWLVWFPVDIYLFAVGKNGPGLGLLIYGLLIISLIDNLIRPFIVSRRTEINSAIVIVGMIGGLFVFGVLGLILGPLILGYVILVLEIYRKKKIGGSIFLKEIKEEPLKIP
jgi:predicted PurR-regulated permease PerM